jgi:superfamily II DNA or RNA helicase
VTEARVSQPLRPYQAEALRAARDAYRAGKRAILLVAPTGAGKTRMGVELVNSAIAKGGTALWLAHREELLLQARDRLRAEGLARVGVIASGEPLVNAPVQVASVQTLAARAHRGLPPGRVVIFDEAHHYAAERWGQVAAAYRDSAILGLTATPERGDGKALGDVFDHVIPVSSVRELQALGVLVPCVTFAPASATKDLAQDPVAAYLARTPGERAFVFCANVAHAERVALSFQAQGVQAATIHADTPWLLRRARLDAFKLQRPYPLLCAGTLEPPPLVLCNVYTLTEGVDVPEASSCILARGCGHAGMMLQMVGRVLRAAPGKTKATLIDLRGVVHKLGLPEADRVWSLEGRAISLHERERDRPLKPCPNCAGMVASWSTDADGWRTCPLCQQRISPPDLPKVAIREIRPMGTAAPPEEQDRVLRRLASTAARRGFKAGWVAHKYRDRFGSWPPYGAAQRALDAAAASLPREPAPHEAIDGFCSACGLVRGNRDDGACEPCARCGRCYSTCQCYGSAAA